MTPLPKRRWSTRRQGKRRASQKIKLPTLTMCNCGRLRRPHYLCPNCGQYKNEKSPRSETPKAKKIN